MIFSTLRNPLHGSTHTLSLWIDPGFKVQGKAVESEPPKASSREIPGLFIKTVKAKSEKLRSLDDLDLKPKKIDALSRFSSLDLATKVGLSQEDPRCSFLAHKRAMDILAMSRLLFPVASSSSDNISPKTVQKIDNFFYGNRIESDVVFYFKRQEVALLKQKKTWKRYTIASGSYHTALISDTEVLKIGKNPFTYKREQDQVNVIYARIGGSNTGIQKRAPHFTEKAILFKATSENKKLPLSYHIEYPYKSNLADLITHVSLTRDERLKIYRSLIAGSKTLIKNGIYHLDAKLQNIGYLEGVQVEHFDLGWSFLTDEVTGQIIKRGILNPELTLKADCDLPGGWGNFFESVDEPIQMPSFLEKVHIFQLGAIFYQVATKQAPYDCDSKNHVEALKKNLEKTLTSQPNPDQSKHVSMILKMLSKKVKDRPNIDEVELAFQNTTGTRSCFSWCF